MTPDEFRSVLSSFTREQFLDFRGRWGGDGESVESLVGAFVYSHDPQRTEQVVVFHLQNMGRADLRTEADKAMALAVQTARAAEESARAAERSATSAANSVRAAWWSQVIALLAIVVTVALFYYGLMPGQP